LKIRAHTAIIASKSQYFFKLLDEKLQKRAPLQADKDDLEIDFEE